MPKILMIVCLLSVSCSRVYVERTNFSRQDKIASLQVNASFKTKNIRVFTVHFTPIDATLLDNCSECSEIKYNIGTAYQERWYKDFDQSSGGKIMISQQKSEAQCIASIRIEKVRGQNPLTVLNPLRTMGKIITYTVSVVDKQSGELIFGMKGEFIYSGPGSIAFLAEDICNKMI
ncbi:MAG: hypothetical protein Q8K40_05410 [Ignavibacteria bacterium]|nr:hypothetical protein [Ignavibacteria bacterium]